LHTSDINKIPKRLGIHDWKFGMPNLFQNSFCDEVLSLQVTEVFSSGHKRLISYAYPFAPKAKALRPSP
jgi:hypothetical protein